MTDAQKSGKSLASLPPPKPSVPDPSFIPCPHCGRRFSELAGERHMQHCKNIKAKVCVLVCLIVFVFFIGLDVRFLFARFGFVRFGSVRFRLVCSSIHRTERTTFSCVHFSTTTSYISNTRKDGGSGGSLTQESPPQTNQEGHVRLPGACLMARKFTTNISAPII